MQTPVPNEAKYMRSGSKSKGDNIFGNNGRISKAHGGRLAPYRVGKARPCPHNARRIMRDFSNAESLTRRLKTS